MDQLLTDAEAFDRGADFTDWLGALAAPPPTRRSRRNVGPGG